MSSLESGQLKPDSELITDPAISTIRYWPSKWVAFSQICLSWPSVLVLISPHWQNYLNTHWAVYLPAFCFTVIMWQVSLVWLTTEWRDFSLVRFIFSSPNKASKRHHGSSKLSKEAHFHGLHPKTIFSISIRWTLNPILLHIL